MATLLSLQAIEQFALLGGPRPAKGRTDIDPQFLKSMIPLISSDL
jgi:hypothetical protein